MSFDHGLDFDWRPEALAAMQARCVSPFLASALRPPNTTPHPSLHTRRDGPCPVQGCGKDRGTRSRAALMVAHPTRGVISAWICKTCKRKADRAAEQVSGGAHLERRDIFSVLKAL